MLTVALIVGFLAISLVFGAGTVLCRPWWLARPATAPAYGLLAVAVVGHIAWVAVWVHQAAGFGYAVLVLLGSAAVLVRARVWGSWRSWLPSLALCAGVGAACVGYNFLWGGGDDPFFTASNRYIPMPPDNFLQQIFADRLWKDESTTLMMGDWNGSDRPPLMSGLLLLARPLGLLLGTVGDDAARTQPAYLQLDFAMSVLSQLLWVPAVQCLLRVLRFSPRVTATSVLFCAVTPVVFTNTTYTWPKLLAAALALGAVALLADSVLDPAPARRAPFVVAVLLTVLAFLAHGGIAFSVPMFLVLGVWCLRRMPRPHRLRSVLLGGGAAVLAYVPWQLYGRLADPTTNRLLKWHLGGVIPPTDESFSHVLVDSYSTTPFSELVHNRWTNLQVVFGPELSARWSTDPGWVGRVRVVDFYGTGLALGLGSFLVVGFLAYVGARRLPRRAARRPLAAAERLAALLVLTCLLCLLLWALVMFLPTAAVVHQGSYAWLLILLAVPFAAIVSRVPGIGIAAIGLSVLYAQLAYFSPTPALDGPLSHGWLLALGGGALVAAAATWWAAHDGAPEETDRAPAYRGRRVAVPSRRASDGERTGSDVPEPAATPRMPRGNGRPPAAATTQGDSQ
jgi:hypothetical protein